jgi:hypothetical protein
MTTPTFHDEQPGTEEPTILNKEFAVGQGKVWLSLVHRTPGTWAHILFTTVFPPETECSPYAPEQQQRESYVDDYEARKAFFSYSQQDAEAFYTKRLTFFTNPLNRSKVTW